LNDAVEALAAAGVAHARPALGMMVEVPTAALAAEEFDVDFFSIGSNDLIQYLTASARDNPAVAPLADPRNPAVADLIRRVVDVARGKGVHVGLCGDMASDPALVPLLLDCGLRAISVAPAQVGGVKLAIHRYRGVSGGAAGRDG
ncbi:MAG: putative PEP-binding protein, partial [Kiloniellaceae bacterium]